MKVTEKNITRSNTLGFAPELYQSEMLTLSATKTPAKVLSCLSWPCEKHETEHDTAGDTNGKFHLCHMKQDVMIEEDW